MIIQLVRKAQKILQRTASATDVRNEYYFKRIYFKRFIQFFKTINDAQQSALTKHTDAEISPLGLKFGSNIHQIKQAMGKPNFSYDNENSHHSHKVLFYRRSFTDISLLVQIQFYNNQVFFIGLDIIRRLINENEKSEIINTVIQKYLHQPFAMGDKYPVIQDKEKNTIILNDDMHFSICYLAGDVNIEKQQKILKSMETIIQDKPEKGSLFYAF